MNPIAAAFRTFFPTMGAQRYRLGHDKLLHALEGRRGRGKSYVMTELVLDMLRAKIPIVTNTRSINWYALALMIVGESRFSSLRAALEWIEANVTVASTWDDLLLAYDAVIILDEATRLFDARPNMSVKAPPLIFEWFKQSRKVRCTTYLVTHSIEWLDVRLRQNLDMYWQVRKVLPKRPRVFAPDGTPVPEQIVLYGLDPGGVGRVDSLDRAYADWIAGYPFSVRVARSYHSWELLQEIGGETAHVGMASIAEHHTSLGRSFGLDGQEELRRHLGRLRGGVGGVHAPARGPALPTMGSM